MGGPGHRIQGDHSLECSGRGPRGSEDDASCSRRASACIQARLRRSAYTVDTVATVRFIKEAQKLGFTLSEVEILLHLGRGGPADCEAVRALATEKLLDLESRVASLKLCITPSSNS